MAFYAMQAFPKALREEAVDLERRPRLSELVISSLRVEMLQRILHKFLLQSQKPSQANVKISTTTTRQCGCWFHLRVMIIHARTSEWMRAPTTAPTIVCTNEIYLPPHSFIHYYALLHFRWEQNTRERRSEREERKGTKWKAIINRRQTNLSKQSIRKSWSRLSTFHRRLRNPQHHRTLPSWAARWVRPNSMASARINLQINSETYHSFIHPFIHSVIAIAFMASWILFTTTSSLEIREWPFGVIVSCTCKRRNLKPPISQSINHRALDLVEMGKKT